LPLSPLGRERAGCHGMMRLVRGEFAQRRQRSLGNDGCRHNLWCSNLYVSHSDSLAARSLCGERGGGGGRQLISARTAIGLWSARSHDARHNNPSRCRLRAPEVLIRGGISLPYPFPVGHSIVDKSRFHNPVIGAFSGRNSASRKIVAQRQQESVPRPRNRPAAGPITTRIATPEAPFFPLHSVAFTLGRGMDPGRMFLTRVPALLQDLAPVWGKPSPRRGASLGFSLETPMASLRQSFAAPPPARDRRILTHFP
jgi:hypothetical protein